MSITIQANPQFLNARTGIYTAWDLRRSMDGDPPGPGVADYESFRVQVRQAGANMSVDVGKTAVGLMQAWVRGSTRGGQGLYRIDNIDTNQATSDAYLSQLNITISANASGNPRIDQVYLAIQDQQHAGASNAAIIDIAVGTPTGGANLDNRTGAASLPANAILLADILVHSGDAAIDNGAGGLIRDRRFYCLAGSIPTPLTAVDQVQFIPATGILTRAATITAGTHDNMQSAALMYLPRRIFAATRVRFRYIQGATANANGYQINIADSSGRGNIGPGILSFSGAANAAVEASLTIAAATFEPGWYYIWMGLAAMTASSTVSFIAADPTVSTSVIGSIARNIALRSATGGSTYPATGTILGATDVASLTSATTCLPVPIITLSVG